MMGEGPLLSSWTEALLWIVAAVTIGACCARALARKSRSKDLIHWPIVGMLPSLLDNMGCYCEWMTKVLIANGGSYQFRGPWCTNLNYYFTADPRNVEHVLRLNFSNYPKGPDFTHAFRDLLGTGVFNVDGELWRLQRKASSLHLNSHACKTFMNELVIAWVESKLLPTLHHFGDSGAPLDLQDLMLRFAFDTTCMIGFGEDTGCVSPQLPSVPFATAFEHALECTTVRFLLPSSWWRALKFLRFGLERHMHASLQVIDGFIGRVICDRRHELLQVDCSNPTRSDLLSCFMQIGVDSHDVKFLKDISINFLLAGRDTSALALSWFFWLVATHPHVEEKIFEEVGRAIGPSDKPAAPTRDNINKMTYLHAALSETLRLYPSVPIDVKHILEDDVLPDGNHVKKNHKLLYNIYAMGRMESIWGPDCGIFRPERWLSDDGTSYVSRVSPFAYAAFNAGPRACLGKGIAYFLMKAVASTLLYNFKVLLLPNHKVVPKLSATLYMKKGLIVTLQPRRPICT